ncbi:TPA: DNA polymerase I [Candidatus Dependentiae bacterium]|nr:MAG: polymerase protein [candidate division TM6 bacterium GW2011_GWF2_43_87]HBL98894.1 DNA polymerase I [Candidatus Dependentiae bacterium]
MHKKTIYLIDGSSFFYRAYYALGSLTTPDGTPVQAVYGFCRMIKRVIDRFSPEYLAVVWDSQGKTVRHTLFENYKATRQATPSDFAVQKELVLEFERLIGLKQFMVSGVEADDILATLARDFSQQGYNVIVISSDKDLGQLATNTVQIYDPFKDKILDQETLEKAYGFPLAKLPFYYALIGDTSDNIPGVRGIGPKTAVALVTQFNSLEELYAHLPSVEKERTRKLLEEHKDEAFLSEKLFQIQYPPISTTIQELNLQENAFDKARPLFERLRFSSLLKLLPESTNSSPNTSPDESSSRPPSLLASVKYQFKSITTEKELEQVCRAIKQKGSCAIDTETTSVKVLQTTLVGISLCYEKGSAFYIPVGPQLTANRTQPKETQMVIGGSPESSAPAPTTLSTKTIINYLKPLFEDASIKKYLHNAKFDLLVLRSTTAMEIKGLAFDTMVAAGLVREDGGQIGLKALSEFYLNERMLSFKDVVTDHKLTTFAEVPLETATQYAAADAHQTLSLVDILQKALISQAMDTLYNTIENPLIQVLCDMEWEGIDIDINVLQELDGKVTKKLAAIKKDIEALVGMTEAELNLNSPQQVSALLFERLKLNPGRKTSGKTGYSTDIDVLSDLAQIHPVPGLIIRYRELAKLKSTYLIALQKEVNPKTGRIHTTFKQTTVATGRLASVEPNLQNIPAEKDAEFSVRSAFKAPEGYRLISADYSQIELRVLAYLSQDPALKQAFLNAEDIHARTASALFDVELKNVTPHQRQVAKRINFSILYGLTPFGLAQDLKISQHDAKLYIDKYMAQYKDVQAWMEKAVEEAKKQGYVTTLWGRRRPVPGIYEKNHTLYQLARRIAINTKAQGTAADLMKAGMVNLADRLKNEMPQVKILLQIHDELIVAAPEREVEVASQLVKETLEHVVEWDIPLVVNVCSGKTWQDVS